MRIFTIFNTVDYLEELREQGYFYTGERVRLSLPGERDLWWGTDAERPVPDAAWDEARQQYALSAVVMVFSHIITGEAKRLYLERKEQSYGLESMLWPEGSETAPVGAAKITLSEDAPEDVWVTGRPSVIQALLQEMDLIAREAVFYPISTDCFLQQTRGSVFGLLYGQGFRPLREGRIRVKEDRYEEQSMAWAGEFYAERPFSPERSEELPYLYQVIVRREWETRGRKDGEEQASCIRREVLTDVYVARSREPIDTICPEGEQPITLQEIPAAEAIGAYLSSMRQADGLLAKNA